MRSDSEPRCQECSRELWRGYRRTKCLGCGLMLCRSCVYTTAKDLGGPMCRDCSEFPKLQTRSQ